MTEIDTIHSPPITLNTKSNEATKVTQKEQESQAETQETQSTIDTIQTQIETFKAEIDDLLHNQNTIPFQIDEVLSRLQQAEKHIRENDNKKAWYDLAKARIALHEGTSISMSELANANADILRQELYKVWHELNSIQREKKHVNTTNAADWLKWGEQALEQETPEKAQVMYCIMRARYSLAKAQEFSQWDKYGYFAIVVESLYLIALPLLIILYAQFSTSPITTTEIMNLLILNVPIYVFIWGFLGGVSWSIYSAAYWAKRRLFDRHYLPWYFAHPWISAVLGGAVSLIILGGLASFMQSSAGSVGTVATTPSISALLSLVSFMAGFSTNSLWKLLDRTVRNMLNVKGSNRNIHENAHKTSIQTSSN